MHKRNKLLCRFYNCVLYSSLQNILAHYSFSFVMYFNEKLKILKIRITVLECKLSSVNKDWLL